MTTITTSTQTVKDQAWILGKLREGVDYTAIVHELPDADFHQLAQAVRRSDELRPPPAPPPRVTRTDRARQEARRAYFRWTDGEDQILRWLCGSRVPLEGLCICLQRSALAIMTRCSRKGLEIVDERRVDGL